VNERPASLFTRPHLFAAFFFIIFIFLLYQMAAIVAPFSSALLWAAVLAMALAPLYRRVVAAVKGKKGLAAGIMTVGTLLIVIGPAVSLFIVLAGQAVDIYQWVSELIKSGKLQETWDRLALPLLDRLAGLPLLQEVDVKGMLIRGISDVSSGMATQMGVVVKDTLLLVVNLLIMLVSLFFFFRDGESFYSSVTGLLPFTHEQQKAISRKFQDTFRAVINGVFLIALLQGIMTGVGFALFRVPFPVFWGFLAAILALLPIGGTALVWIPGAIYLYATGSGLSSILLAVWGMVFVSLPDNFLKPLIIGKKANIPTFLLFIGILGGLKVYGFLGILAGPLVVTLLTAFVQIYREEFMEK
jgi:predicted PurR-regulated permease PerM